MHPPTSYEPSPELLPNLGTDRHVQHPVFSDTPCFRCPHCQAVTAFEVAITETPVRVFPELAAFDKASRPLRAQGCNHEDFDCQGCGRAVRVVYGVVEFAMGSYLFVPTQVLIGAPAPVDPGPPGRRSKGH